jgi:uncharacterized protein YfaP (DUF2135 family)
MLAGLEIMPDYLKEKLSSRAESIIESSSEGNENVQEHVVLYNNLLRQGNKVMLVSHSQGNFFGNIAYAGLEDEYKEGFMITQVASPANYIATDPSNTSYTTITEDYVMGLVKQKLPANVNNFSILEDRTDWTGHSFIDSYLAEGKPAVFHIISNLASNIRKAKFPNSFDGYRMPFNFDYSWSGNFDTDMHIIDPDGTHVYSGNPKGTSGIMPDHSSDGSGSEYYELNCRLEMPGTYKIGLQRIGDTPEYIWGDFRYSIDDVNSRYSGISGSLGYSGQNGEIVWRYELYVTEMDDGGYSTKWILLPQSEDKEPFTLFEGLFYLEKY